MKSRAGLTLVECLVAIFIMGVGMLAILTLFPLGVMNCGQAMQDDRAAQCARNAAAIANAWDLRNSNNVNVAFSANPPGVYIDPWYAGLAPVLGSTIPRRNPDTPQGVAWPGAFPQWFGLTDDYNFTTDGGLAGAGAGAASAVRNSGTYTWCYMLRRPQPTNPPLTELSVVVYKGRVTQTPDGETAFTAASTLASAPNTITVTASGQPPAIRKTGWILDPATAQFYRVISIVPTSATSFMLETQLPLKADVSSVIVMENVIEVFEKGFGK